jgi:hypothetical protein
MGSRLADPCLTAQVGLAFRGSGSTAPSPAVSVTYLGTNGHSADGACVVGGIPTSLVTAGQWRTFGICVPGAEPAATVGTGT